MTTVNDSQCPISLNSCLVERHEIREKLVQTFHGEYQDCQAALLTSQGNLEGYKIGLEECQILDNQW